MSDCPVNAERLPPNLRRYVDANGPVPGRMMAARAMVPMGPVDMAHVLFMLGFDPDEKVRETAKTTAAGLSEKILGVALRDESLSPHVLDFFGRALVGKDNFLQLLVLNNSTTDETVAAVAVAAGPQLAESISQNQLRLLRHTEILRNLCQNPSTSKATVDLACDFAVRSGVLMDDVAQMKEARIRIHGADAPPPVSETAEQILAEETSLLADDAPPPSEGKRLTLTQRIMKMNVAEKIKLATLGNKEARTLLLRDTNKLVSIAAVRSPRITDGEILSMAHSRTAPDDVLRFIFQSRDWTKQYPIRLALVKNPKVPLPTALKFLSTMRDSELKDLARDKNVPSAVQQQARKMVEKKNAPVKVGKE